MLALATHVTKFCRDAFRPGAGDERGRRLVTAAAVFSRRLLTLPVTVETEIVTGGAAFQMTRRQHERIRQPEKGRRRTRKRPMADRAVVISFRLVIKDSPAGKRGGDKARSVRCLW